MAHPFFESLSYPWHLPEARQLYEVLKQAYRNAPQIDLLYRSCAPRLPNLALGDSPDIIWKSVLENLCIIEGALQQLCCTLLSKSDAHILLKEAAQTIIEARPVTETKILSESVILLDRENLRDQLDSLQSDESPVKVLLVRGGPQSGKTHSRHLFERIARVEGAIAVYLCDGIVVTVNDVFEQLFTVLKGSQSDIPTRNSTEDAWYRTVCVKLLQLAESNDLRVWIAVDDLGYAPDGAPLLDSAIRVFFEQFALSMMNPAFRRRFRLMLIHYPEGRVPTKWNRDFWVEDCTDEYSVNEEHIIELLRVWATKNKHMVIEEEIKALANAVVTKVDGDIPDQEQTSRLQRIHDTLTASLKDLKRRSQ